MLETILQHIPQRAPFLFLDKIIDFGEDFVVCSKTLTGQEDFFKGHFPGNPVMPGVLLCEACFQAGALLMSLRGEESQGKTALVTRIQSTKFKSMVKPLDELTIQVHFNEMLANTAFMRGKIIVNTKVVMTVEFAATLVAND
jgi:3-hydroxyacyl-[acyl-carrier-protein] dehydratase